MMRVYFIFNINKDVYDMYKYNPYRIYKMLEEIYYTKHYDVLSTYKLFNEICLFLNKDKIGEYIYTRCHKDDSYKYKENAHIYTDKDEITKMSINNSNIKIRTNFNYPLFLRMLSHLDKNLFVCDFVNKDYFILHKLKNNYRQIDKNIVKYY